MVPVSEAPENWEPPIEMMRPDGTPRFAFATFLMLNDNYLPGALVLAFGADISGRDCVASCGVLALAVHATGGEDQADAPDRSWIARGRD